ncbi:hypothetical protein LTR65_001428 [Meristemomyces frigidus]
MEEPSDDENDMLDLAFGLTETSRLGCQVEMRKELDGLVLSSAPRISRIPHRIRTPASSLQAQQWQRQIGLSIPVIASIRHASTAPSPPPPAASSTPPPPPPPEALGNSLDTITLDSIDLGTAADISQIPESIGYLQSIGISYGYGPTSMIEWLLEHIHVYSGMPWWGSIAVTALALRMLTFPFYLRSSDATAKMSALVSVTKPLTQKMQESQRDGNNEAVMVAWQQLNAVKKRAGISWGAQFAPVVMQGIIGFCGFKLLRAMSTLPVPGFRDGGFLWLSDLTLSDPYGVMPILMGGAMHLLFRLGGESGSTNTEIMTPAMKNMMLYAMPGVIILVMGWQPGALCVWFATTGAFSMGQALLLQRPAVRKFFGIAPIYKPTIEEAKGASPLQAMLDGYMKPGSSAKRERDGLRPSIDMGASGKNAAYMQPQWQAPNIHTKASSSSSSSHAGAGRIIDVQASSTSATPNRSTTSKSSTSTDSDMIPPPKSMFPSGIPGSSIVSNVMDKAKDTLRGLNEAAKERGAKRQKKDQRQAAEAYEKRAKERGR